MMLVNSTIAYSLLRGLDPERCAMAAPWRADRRSLRRIRRAWSVTTWPRGKSAAIAVGRNGAQVGRDASRRVVRHGPGPRRDREASSSSSG